MINRIDFWSDGNLLRFQESTVEIYKCGRTDLKPAVLDFWELKRMIHTVDEQLDNLDGSE